MDDAQAVKEEIKKRNHAGTGVLIIIGSRDFRHGTGRSLIAKTLASALNAKHYSTGDQFRDNAKKKKMSINEYVQYIADHPDTEKKFDEDFRKQVNGLTESGKNVVADSNLLANFIKADASIAIDAQDAIRAQRVYAKHRAGDAKYASPADALARLKERDEDDKQRYKLLYGIDARKLTQNYDGHVDNSGELDESMDRVFLALKEKLCAKEKK